MPHKLTKQLGFNEYSTNQHTKAGILAMEPEDPTLSLPKPATQGPSGWGVVNVATALSGRVQGAAKWAAKCIIEKKWFCDFLNSKFLLEGGGGLVISHTGAETRSYVSAGILNDYKPTDISAIFVTADPLKTSFLLSTSFLSPPSGDFPITFPITSWHIVEWNMEK